MYEIKGHHHISMVTKTRVRIIIFIKSTWFTPCENDGKSR